MKGQCREISSIKKRYDRNSMRTRSTKRLNPSIRIWGRKPRSRVRPGKVPRNILERYFKDYVKAEVIQKTDSGYHPQALSETDLSRSPRP